MGSACGQKSKHAVTANADPELADICRNQSRQFLFEQDSYSRQNAFLHTMYSDLQVDKKSQLDAEVQKTKELELQVCIDC